MHEMLTAAPGRRLSHPSIVCSHARSTLELHCFWQNILSHVFIRWLTLTFMNSFMVVGGYFWAGPWMRTSSLGHTNQPME